MLTLLLKVKTDDQCSDELGKLTSIYFPRLWRNEKEIVHAGLGCYDKSFHISYHKKDKRIVIKENKCCQHMKLVKILIKKIVLNELVVGDGLLSRSDPLPDLNAELKYCNNPECSSVKSNKNLFLNRDKNADITVITV